MCSISWKWSRDRSENSPSLSIFFNRDEQRSRPRAEPPRINTEQSLHFLAPVDPLRGGTWMGVNASGIAVTLLNNYAVLPNQNTNYQSRGHIVSSLLKQPSISEMITSLEKLVLSAPHPAFSILIFDPVSQKVHGFSWDEKQLSPLTFSHHFFTSSSWNTEQVQAYRLNSFIEQVIEKGVSHEQFHFQTPQASKKSSVFMERERTWTVSRTHLSIYSHKAVIEYFERTDTTPHVSLIDLRYEKNN